MYTLNDGLESYVSLGKRKFIWVDEEYQWALVVAYGVETLLAGCKDEG